MKANEHTLHNLQVDYVGRLDGMLILQFVGACLRSAVKWPRNTFEAIGRCCGKSELSAFTVSVALCLASFCPHLSAEENASKLTFTMPSERKPIAPEDHPVMQALENIPSLTKKAEAGDVQAMYDLGDAHYGPNERLQHLLQATRQDMDRFDSGPLNRDGVYRIKGRIFVYADLQKQAEEVSDLIRTNTELAVNWYRKAAENGHAEGQVVYAAHLFETGKDSEAIEWIRKAVATNTPSAHLALGWAAIEGRGVEQDDVAAYRSYLKAAQGGNAWGMKRVADCLINGFGTELDSKAAYDWYLKAGEGGVPEGWYLAGMINFNGTGRPADEAAALELLAKAGNAGVVEAMSWYAMIAFEHKAYAEALQWHSLAASGGKARSLTMVGLCHYHGLGTQPDREYARQLWHQAADAGDSLAMKMLAKAGRRESLERLEEFLNPQLNE